MMEGYIDVNDIIESWNQNDFTSDERFKFWCLLNDLKKIDIVRCKDCVHCKHWYGDKGLCFLWHEDGIDVFEDGYCSYGKKEVYRGCNIITVQAQKKERVEKNE